MYPNRGTNSTFPTNVMAKPPKENHAPHWVRSVTLYHTERLKKIPENISATITIGMTYNPA